MVDAIMPYVANCGVTGFRLLVQLFDELLAALLVESGNHDGQSLGRNRFAYRRTVKLIIGIPDRILDRLPNVTIHCVNSRGSDNFRPYLLKGHLHGFVPPFLEFK
jgi:hypothetical protein